MNRSSSGDPAAAGGIRVQLFAAARELAGAAEVTVPVDGPITAAELRTRLGAHAPALAALLRYSRLAINAAYANDEDRAAPGDDVALIPPVSGG
jgi:molybdopterin synthase catalytic subunit/molybdopterin synthase sulfur carrier subunit